MTSPLNPPQLTPFQKFCNKWQNGCGGHACKSARNIVLCRGKVPCDVLFVAEAPGESEDILGEPLVGPSGHLFDQIVEQASFSFRVCEVCRRGSVFRRFPSEENPSLCLNSHTYEDSGPLRFGYTNLVGCIPRNEEEGGKADQPLPEDIHSCSPRLREFVALCKPKLIVCVGALSRDWLDPKMRGSVWELDMDLQARKSSRLASRSQLAQIPRIDIAHPASIVRMNVAMQGLAAQRCIVKLRTALEEYLK